MTTGPEATIWTAEPHTIAKIDILESYLVAYFQILGRYRKILYIDGFSGPNKYVNRSSGSPGAALSAATKAVLKSTVQWSSGQIQFAFVEKDQDRYNSLEETVAAIPLPGQIQVNTFKMEFTSALAEIKKRVPEPFTSNCPLFVFIDPFGAKGAPFECVAEILNSPCSEVLINLDADGVSRIFAAKQAANYKEVLNDIFGDSSWVSELRDDQPFAVRCRKILELYKNRLRTLPGVRYIFEVEMQGGSGTLNYFLVFASKHPLGLQKMKEAMGSIAQYGTYTFSDARVGQTSLFRSDEPLAYYLSLHAAFNGQTVPYDSLTDEITAFALNETPFVNAKPMLVILEREGRITVTAADASRKRGSFNDKVKEIRFHERIQHELF